MKCPKCNKGSLKYRYPKREVEVKDKGNNIKKVLKRATNEAICTKCGYRGVSQ